MTLVVQDVREISHIHIMEHPDKIIVLQMQEQQEQKKVELFQIMPEILQTVQLIKQ